MRNSRRTLIVLGIPALLAACATPGPSTVPPQRPVSGRPQPQPQRPAREVPPTDPRPSVPGEFLAPKVMNDSGLEYVIGARASQLEQVFGPARLDVLEGDARKMQFVGEACVLDVYLYPLRPGAEPTATYVDARRASDALDVDRVACANALKR